MNDELNSKGSPFLIGRDYNFSSHESSSLVIDLQAWLGHEIDERLDFETLIGLVAVVGIQHKPGRNGDYAQLSSINQPPKGIEPRRTPRTEPVFFAFSPDAPIPEVFSRLPEWAQKKIAASPEYRKATGQKALPALPEHRRQNFLHHHRSAVISMMMSRSKGR